MLHFQQYFSYIVAVYNNKESLNKGRILGTLEHTL